MKILHLITSIDKGGAETNVINLAKIQSENNLNVLILYAKGEGYWKKKFNLKFKKTSDKIFFL